MIPAPFSLRLATGLSSISGDRPPAGSRGRTRWPAPRSFFLLRLPRNPAAKRPAAALRVPPEPARCGRSTRPAGGASRPAGTRWRAPRRPPRGHREMARSGGSSRLAAPGLTAIAAQTTSASQPNGVQSSPAGQIRARKLGGVCRPWVRSAIGQTACNRQTPPICPGPRFGLGSAVPQTSVGNALRGVPKNCETTSIRASAERHGGRSLQIPSFIEL